MNRQGEPVTAAAGSQPVEGNRQGNSDNVESEEHLQGENSKRRSWDSEIEDDSSTSEGDNSESENDEVEVVIT